MEEKLKWTFDFQPNFKFLTHEKGCQSDGGHLAMMKTPWHNAFVAAMTNSDVFVGIKSESDLGKHFTWMDGDVLSYTQWRSKHPTHHNLVNDGSKVAVLLHKRYESGSEDAILAGQSVIYPGDWEDVLSGVANKGYAVCSVEASSQFTNQGIAYPVGFPDRTEIT